MMDITDRRFRFFIRAINSRVKLYTEMIVSHAIVRGDRQRLLNFDESEHPVILQLGGDDPAIMAEAAAIGADFGYDGVDINCGCPSDRVENGNFGVCLMREPARVGQIVSAIRARIKIPVSVKCRIGITGEESEAGLIRFIDTVFASGASQVTIHARTATLKNFSPKQNREIPPLQYDLAYRVKQQMPKRAIEINGGIKTIEAIKNHLEQVDRVMIGRLAHEDPFFFAENGDLSLGARLAVLEKVADYAARTEKDDITAAKYFSNMLNIFHALPGARSARRFLSEEGRSLSPRAAVNALGIRTDHPCKPHYHPSDKSFVQ